MAEYYPLISRAVAGLRDGAPAPRQAIYDRARQALVGQLRGMQPPIPEDAIDKEIRALDEAIDRIEAELAPKQSVSDLASAAVEAALLFGDPVPALPGPPALAPAPGAVTPKPPVNRPAPPPPLRPAAPPAARQDRPVFTPRPSLPATRGTRPDAPAAPPSSPPVVEAPTLSVPLPVAPTLSALVPSADPAPVVEPSVNEPMPAVPDIAVAPTIDPPADEVPTGDIRSRDESGRPAMPRQSTRAPRNGRIWIVALAALATVVVIALTAWKLRDRPEELVRAPIPPPQVEATPGKIVERADGTVVGDDEAAEIQPTAPAAPASPAPVGSAAQAVLPVSASSAGTAAQPANDQMIPVSYKAAVLVAAPDTPEKVTTYVGSVVWRVESANAGQDQKVTTAVRADIDVPDAKMQMTMEIRKNTEAQFPASHTIDIKFTPGPGSPMGNVKQIDVPQMRREDAATGEPLVGVPVTITNNYFLVGLTRGEAEARNVEAMRSRGWFDIPMVLEDGKPAKITFEKGASGDRIIADALATWSKP